MQEHAQLLCVTAPGAARAWGRARVLHGQAGAADGGHGGRAVALSDGALHADGVRELVLRAPLLRQASARAPRPPTPSAHLRVCAQGSAGAEGTAQQA